MSLPLRLGLVYAAMFIGTGASSPYMPVWFTDRGLSGAQIGLLLSAPMLARALTGPLIAVWADSFRLRRTPLIIMGWAAAAALGLLAALRLGPALDVGARAAHDLAHARARGAYGCVCTCR